MGIEIEYPLGHSSWGILYFVTPVRRTGTYSPEKALHLS